MPRGAKRRFTPDQVKRMHKAVCATVGRRFGISVAKLLTAPQRRGSHKNPNYWRHIAIYLLRIQGVPVHELMRLFSRRSPQGIYYACAKIEDQRDELGFDGLMDDLEAAYCRRLAGLPQQ